MNAIKIEPRSEIDQFFSIVDRPKEGALVVISGVISSDVLNEFADEIVKRWGPTHLVVSFSDSTAGLETVTKEQAIQILERIANQGEK